MFHTVYASIDVSYPVGTGLINAPQNVLSSLKNQLYWNESSTQFRNTLLIGIYLHYNIGLAKNDFSQEINDEEPFSR